MALNNPWLDPRNVDWTDSFNPLKWPGWSQNNNPFMYASLADPMWQAIRNAAEVEPRILVAPDPMDQLIPAGSTYDQAVSIDPFTWLLGINCSQSNPEGPGFYFQITDAVTGAQVFSQPVLSRDFQPSGFRGCVAWLPSPRYFAPPSYPIVRIINNDQNNAQTCTVNLFTALEIGN